MERAHLTFAGGGLMLPAHTPYDRQMVREHVLNYARHVEHLQVHVGRITWIVERPDDGHPFVCQRCMRHLTVAALHAPPALTTYCVACALR